MEKSTLRFTFVTFLMLFSGALSAQWQQRDLGTAQTSNKMYAYSPDTAFIVGNNKILLRTNDKGSNWNSAQVTLTKSTLNYSYSDIAFSGRQDGYIVTKKAATTNENGLILHSADKGSTWNELTLTGFSNASVDVAQNPTLGVQWNFTAIACTETTIYVSLTWKNTALTTTYGHIFKSADKGITWTILGSDYAAITINGICASGNLVYIGGSSGLFKVSADAGATWTDYSSSATYTSINNLRLFNESTVYLATTKGTFRTVNSGAIVTQLNTYGSFDVINTSDLSVIFSGGTNINIVRSINDGTSWQAAKQGLGTANIWDLTYFNGSFYALCNAGIVYTITPNQLQDPVAGFTATATGNTVSTVNTSQNGGSYSWNFGDATAVSTEANPTHAYTAYNTYKIKLEVSNAVATVKDSIQLIIAQPVVDFNYVIEDNKVTFTNIAAGCTTYDWNFGTGPGSKAVSPSFIYPQLGSFVVTLTGNNGIESLTASKTITIDTVSSQWSYILTGSDQILQKLHAFNNDTAIIVGNATTIIRTTDGGGSWIPAIFPAANAGFIPNDIIFFDDQNGLISYSASGSTNGFILKTTDNGQNWAPIALSAFSDGTGNAESDPAAATASKVFYFFMASTSGTTGYVVLRWQDAANAYHGYVYKTIDQGATWSKMNQDIFKDYAFSSFITCMAFSGDGSTGYIGGNKFLLKTIDGGATWTNISKNEYGYITDIVIKDANIVFISTSVGTMKTTDGFSTFKVLYLPGDYSFDIIAINDSTYLSGKDYNTLKISRDNGTTWTRSSEGIGSTFYELSIFNNKVYALASGGKAYISNLDFYNKPMLDFSYTTNNKDVTFTNLSTNTKSYEWAFGDGLNSTEVLPTHPYANSGVYSVTLTGGNLCWKGASKTIDIIILLTGVDTKENNNFQIWPNPVTQGQVNLSPCETFRGGATVNVTDIQGRLVYTQKIDSSCQLTVNLKPGMYVVSVVGNNIAAIQKLIVK